MQVKKFNCIILLRYFGKVANFIFSYQNPNFFGRNPFCTFYKSTVLANTFTNRIVNEWSALPSIVTDADSINKFKNEYDAFRSNQQS
ncbi:hypothetical protein BpHYR1_053155 [Brachionus plicatilis]|uniref:RNA-directed DNA polymerase from mobile element jockey-like n=1 Tax=Brachionus plicatilis TaxID=10195 RepID=A0A3M7QBD4_BRAPC|nr:hypothetical protein BpHYR1_053155 [Brachionus plicatilis]